MGKAFTVPNQQMGIHATVGEDGVWLHFTSLSGKCCALNIADSLLAKLGTGLVCQALREWRDDMLAAASQEVPE